MLAKSIDVMLQDQDVKALNASDTIILHTKIAHSLWNGIPKPHRKIGLVQFASMMSALCKAVSSDDPYAEWYLLQTYKAIAEAIKLLAVLENLAQSHIDGLRGIDVVLWQAIKPKRFPLMFGNKFSSITAYRIIANADHVLRQILTLDKYGVLLNQDTLSKQGVIDIVKKVFLTPIKWKNMQITRQDVKENNEKAQQAKKYYGDLPESVLNQKKTLSIIPKSRAKDLRYE